ncbi:Sugar-specific transcriptional regulator TrmB [uncultured archaeon]|nr:Sugar-specific transcriptional regulator TrmB [uncultured archaeon]
MEIERLMEIGLTRREANAYVALLGLESARAGEIARFLREDRTNAYDSLSGLVKKGLASYVTKGNATYYRAAPPERLLDFLSEKEKSIREVLPRLSEVYKSYPKKPTVETFEGREGIKTIFSDILREGREIVGYGATDKVLELIPESTKRYMQERKKKGIRSRQLYFEGDKPLKTGMTEYRSMPREFSGPASTFIYGDKVAIMLWFTEPPVSFLIKSNAAADAYRNKFEFMWKHAKK